MNSNRITPIEYVFSSATRRATLTSLAAGPRDRRTVVDRLDASESAVYDAFAGLAEWGLIYRTDDRWSVTGAGRAVADCLERCERVDAAILEAPQYWRTHDLSALPRALRESIATATDGTIVRPTGSGTGGDAALASVLDEGHSTRVFLADSRPGLLDALEPVADVRVVCDPSFADRDALVEIGATSGGGTAGAVRSPGARQRPAVRTDAVEYAMVATESAVGFALPALEGGPAGDGVVLVDDDAVVERCWRHFDARWRRAAPLEAADRSLSH